ncbi:hypothetical protein ALO95_200399 [Pseudomonas syringae pv. antirrhini]|uniref:DUF4286 family protein n=1 Tax=Pseudomonas syringae group genomosp. 3 TaxID=251701 RepID=UPI000ABE8615|nr:DUF4286 family protein [Pseudomonas syringae group genomosp. 3]RMP42544.1 hypothetical protein ALQ23_200081 [Pseudomonas syringae pv. antirrhini]RMW23442.1 hypothetical protein ALO95_200399 [Pseudomonas syringae pv. antirrhini]
MSRYSLVVLLNAAEGRDEELNDWWTNTHIPDVLQIPGFISAQRHRLAEIQRDGAGREWKYLTIYQVDTDDVQNLFDELKRRAGTAQMRSTDSYAPGGQVHLFESVSPLIFPTEGLPNGETFI